MPNPRYGNLRTLHCCRAQTENDGASNRNIDFLTYYWEILGKEGHKNRMSGSKIMVIFLNLTKQRDSCPVSNDQFYYLNNQNCLKCLVPILKIN